MKLSFSTVCCSGWGFDEIFAAAKDFGFDGIELSRIGNRGDVTEDRHFQSQNVKSTAERLTDGMISVPLISIGISLSNDTEQSPNAFKSYFELAKQLNSPNIRIGVVSDKDFNPDFASANYECICREAEDYGVSVLIETAGYFGNSKVLADFLSGINSTSKGVLWDICYPYALHAEKPEETYANIGSFVKAVHIKDAIFEDGKITYKLLGHGELPILEIMTILERDFFDGYASFEWQKKWSSDFDEPGIALAHYVSYMRRLLRTI